MFHAIESRSDTALCDLAQALATLKHATSALTTLWDQCTTLNVADAPPRPPAHAIRLTSATLNTYLLWNHVSCLLQLANVLLNPSYHQYKYIPHKHLAAQAIWYDTLANIPIAKNPLLWMWCRPQEAYVMLHSLPHMTLDAQSELQGTVWALYASLVATTSMDTLQHVSLRFSVNMTTATYPAISLSPAEMLYVAYAYTTYAQHTNKNNWGTGHQPCSSALHISPSTHTLL